MIVNHIGLRVSDLERSIRFYGALGFDESMAMDVPDDRTAQLLQVPAPVGLRAVYLTNGPFVLELLAYEHHPAAPVERTMTDTGLTHLSIGVDDVAAAKDAVAGHGGEIVEASDVGVAVMVRDPDGQLIELLDVRYRPVTP
jgi:catechol 2,3-dioxygenase-like lactoylglutathione lyase family enzyme